MWLGFERQTSRVEQTDTHKIQKLLLYVELYSMESNEHLTNLSASLENLSGENNQNKKHCLSFNISCQTRTE